MKRAYRVSFLAFIRSQPVADTPEGSFVRDAQIDFDFPDVASLIELETYLSRSGANFEARAAARRLWDAYAAKNAETQPAEGH